MSDPTDHGISAVESLWCTRDVAKFLNVSQATLSRWRREKVGPPFIQLAGISRYNPATVRNWVREQESTRG